MIINNIYNNLLKLNIRYKGFKNKQNFIYKILNYFLIILVYLKINFFLNLYKENKNELIKKINKKIKN